MTSERKKATNRSNAEKSTGPKTSAGKATISGNAVRHGILSRHLVVPGESREEFDALFEALQVELKPVGLIESSLAERVVIALWRQQRLVKAESAEITLRREERSRKVESEVKLRLGLMGNDDRVYEALQRPGSEEQMDLDTAEEETILARLTEAMGWNITDSDALREHDEYLYGVIVNFCEALGTTFELLLAEAGSMREMLTSIYFRYERLVQNGRIAKTMRLVHTAMSLPEATDVLARYQSALDNDLYKALRALRESQSFRKQNLPDA